MSEGNGLPPGWARTDLETVAVTRDDLRQPVNATDRAKRVGPYPYYGATGQVGWIDGYRMDGEYVLLGEDGAPFLDSNKPKAYIVSGKCWVNNHAHVLHGAAGITNNRFLMYALNATDYYDFVSGTTRLKLTQGAMKQIPISLPPLPEQRRIVAAIEEQFTRLDAEVTALERARKGLKRYRASVLKAAVEGRLTKQWRDQNPDAESGSALLERILEERRAKWEEAQLAKYAAKEQNPPKNWRSKYKEPAAPDIAGLPELPEGWSWARLDSLASIKGGITKDSKRRYENSRTVPYLRVANVQRGYLDLSELKEIEASEAVIEQLRLESGDVLFTEGGDRDKLGRGWIWSGEVAECIHQNHIFRAKPYSAEIQSKFVSWFGNTFGQVWFMKQGKQTTNLASINVTKLSAFPVPLPPPAEQEEIVAEVERRLSVIEEVEAQVEADLKRAARLRQSILKRAFEGKLVPQDPSDEPASVLLERIRQEREQAPARKPKRKKPLGKRPKGDQASLFSPRVD